MGIPAAITAGTAVRTESAGSIAGGGAAMETSMGTAAGAGVDFCACDADGNKERSAVKAPGLDRTGERRGTMGIRSAILTGAFPVRTLSNAIGALLWSDAKIGTAGTPEGTMIGSVYNKYEEGDKNSEYGDCLTRLKRKVA